MAENHWIFISPHFDDVALSCGGLVWDLVHQGAMVEVWTILAGFPLDENYSEFARQNHRTWGRAGDEAIHLRRDEDRAACEVLGAKHRHFHWADAIYRRDPATSMPIVRDNQTLFGTPPEESLVDEVARVLQQTIPVGAVTVFPMGLGSHIDHLLVSRAGEGVNCVKYYYADYPYILEHFDQAILFEKQLTSISRPLSAKALQAWQAALLCYTSQLSGFWRDPTEMRLVVRNYLAGGGGRLWVLTQKGPDKGGE